MPFSVTIDRTFCAAHALRLPGGKTEPIHGHNWHLSLIVARDDGGLDALDCVIDFHDLEARLDRVIGPWHNANLNDVEPFRTRVNPSAERVAEAVADALDLPSGARVIEVGVTEAEGCRATYRPDVKSPSDHS